MNLDEALLAMMASGVKVRQGKVTAISAVTVWPILVTVEMDGVALPNIICMDHVSPTVNEGIWLVDKGGGQWMAFGTIGSSKGGKWTRITNTNVQFGSMTTNVTSVMDWQYDGDYINCEVAWGTSGAPSAGNIAITVPIATIAELNGGNSFKVAGPGAMTINQGVARFIGIPYFNADINLQAVLIANTVGTVISNWTETAPHTWGSSDYGTAVLRYRWR